MVARPRRTRDQLAISAKIKIKQDLYSLSLLSRRMLAANKNQKYNLKWTKRHPDFLAATCFSARREQVPPRGPDVLAHAQLREVHEDGEEEAVREEATAACHARSTFNILRIRATCVSRCWLASIKNDNIYEFSSMPKIIFKDPNFERTPCDLLLHAFVQKYILPLAKSSSSVVYEIENWKLCWENFSATTRLDGVFNHMIEMLSSERKQIFIHLFGSYRPHRKEIEFTSWSSKVIDWIVRVSYFRISATDQHEWTIEVLKPSIMKNHDFFTLTDEFLKKQRQSSYDSFKYIDRIIDNMNNVISIDLQKSMFKDEMGKVILRLKSFESSRQLTHCQTWIVRFMKDIISETDDNDMIRNLVFFEDECHEQLADWEEDKDSEKNILQYFSVWSNKVQPAQMNFINCEFKTRKKKLLYESVFVLNYMVQSSTSLTEPFKEEWDREVLRNWFTSTEDAAEFFKRAEGFFTKYKLVTEADASSFDPASTTVPGSKTQACRANKYFVVLKSYC